LTLFALVSGPVLAQQPSVPVLYRDVITMIAQGSDASTITTRITRQGCGATLGPNERGGLRALGATGEVIDAIVRSCRQLFAEGTVGRAFLQAATRETSARVNCLGPKRSDCERAALHALFLRSLEDTPEHRNILRQVVSRDCTDLTVSTCVIQAQLMMLGEWDSYDDFTLQRADSVLFLACKKGSAEACDVGQRVWLEHPEGHRLDRKDGFRQFDSLAAVLRDNERRARQSSVPVLERRCAASDDAACVELAGGLLWNSSGGRASPDSVNKARLLLRTSCRRGSANACGRVGEELGSELGDFDDLPAEVVSLVRRGCGTGERPGSCVLFARQLETVDDRHLSDELAARLYHYSCRTSWYERHRCSLAAVTFVTIDAQEALRAAQSSCMILNARECRDVLDTLARELRR